MIIIIIIIIMVFNCPFTYMKICETLNIRLWEKKINFDIINQKRLNYFNLSDKNDYILLIKSNINNPDKLREIYNLYKTNQIIETKRIEAIEKETKELIINNSISYINDNIYIKLLSECDLEQALLLYNEYKKEVKEAIDELNDYISDYILKNQIYGIFINNTNNNNLIGCVIINTKKIKIDDIKINTFYIQELFININYQNKNYGNLLFNYIINKCPDNLNYISFMTKPENKAMYRIAEKNNFILQKKLSGDINNPSLFILKK